MKKLLFSLLRYAVCDNVAIENTGEIEEHLTEIYSLAKKHDLGSVIAYGAQKLGIENDILAKEKALSVFRVEKLKFAAAQACDVLEKAKIAHMLLKGAHLRGLYPEEWLRTSCDIDIYTDINSIDEAVSALEGAGFTAGRRHTHDIMLTAPNKCTLELHFVLMTSDYLPKAANLLSHIWEHTDAVGEYQRKMNDEMFYFYHIAHMARHMKTGGCGIRPFLDLWLLCNRQPGNPKRRELCIEGGLDTFERASCRLAQVWFEGKEYTPDILTLEEYILSGEVYGSKHNAAASRGGRVKYLCSRIFMPYEQLKLKYPALDGKPLLTPVYTVRRWFNLLEHKTAEASVKELRASASVTSSETQKFGKLFKSLKL